MSQPSEMPMKSDRTDQPAHTLAEIFQQPTLWPTTLDRVRNARRREGLLSGLDRAAVLVTGAGSSAHAATAVSAAWPHSLAVPSTDLLVNAVPFLSQVEGVISLARSGESPESAGVVKTVRALRPEVWQIAIVCNEDSALFRSGLDGVIVLDPRSNDRSLVMTSAFSNLVLAGLCLACGDLISTTIDEAVKRATTLLPTIDNLCQSVAIRVRDRIVVLSSSPMLGWAREAGLKAMEMTSGRFPVVTETFLGLRHGPMSFLRQDTLVLCLLSNDPLRRQYEVDLIRELQSKNLGYLVGIADPAEYTDLFDVVIPAILPTAADALRTPYEILAPQLIGYHLSLSIGMNPDNPSPDGVISRVVQGFRIHAAAEDEIAKQNF
jgi:D-galactosamine 6-phosphate deaminase/isomerase